MLYSSELHLPQTATLQNLALTAGRLRRRACAATSTLLVHAHFVDPWQAPRYWVVMTDRRALIAADRGWSVDSDLMRSAICLFKGDIKLLAPLLRQDLRRAAWRRGFSTTQSVTDEPGRPEDFSNCFECCTARSMSSRLGWRQESVFTKRHSQAVFAIPFLLRRPTNI